MTKTMLFGTLYGASGPGTSSTTVNARMSLVPVPDTGMEGGSEGWSSTLLFGNGGADVVSSPASHRVYEMDWNLREASGASGLDIIKNYWQKVYGPGLIYWSDPGNHGASNLLDPVYSAPGLIELGHKNIYNTTPTYSNVTASAYGHPSRKATWDVTSAINTYPTDTRQISVVPIPADMTLHLGFSGAATGSAVVQVKPINLDGSYASVTNLTLLTDTASTRLNATFSGATYKAVEIYITRTVANASTLTLTSGMAQLWPSTYSPTLTGPWLAGQGMTGAKFEGSALPEVYVQTDLRGSRRLKGLSATLVEVGRWTKYV
jgi:hypothetical protein